MPAGFELKIYRGGKLTKEERLAIAKIIKKLYWEQELSQAEIGKELKVSQVFVQSIMKEFNIPKRTLSKAFKIKRDKRGWSNIPKNASKLKKWKHKQSLIHKRLWANEEWRRMNAEKCLRGLEKGRGFVKHHSQRTKDRIRDTKNRQYRDNPEIIEKIRQARLEQVFAHISSLEIIIMDELERKGIEYEPQYSFGKRFILDFALPRYKIGIECNGLYWHNREDKRMRDKRLEEEIKRQGWKLLTLWEDEIKRSPEECVNRLEVLVAPPSSLGGR